MKYLQQDSCQCVFFYKFWKERDVALRHSYNYTLFYNWPLTVHPNVYSYFNCFHTITSLAGVTVECTDEYYIWSSARFYRFAYLEQRNKL